MIIRTLIVVVLFFWKSIIFCAIDQNCADECWRSITSCPVDRYCTHNIMCYLGDLNKALEQPYAYHKLNDIYYTVALKLYSCNITQKHIIYYDPVNPYKPHIKVLVGQALFRYDPPTNQFLDLNEGEIADDTLSQFIKSFKRKPIKFVFDGMPISGYPDSRNPYYGMALLLKHTIHRSLFSINITPKAPVRILEFNTHYPDYSSVTFGSDNINNPNTCFYQISTGQFGFFDKKSRASAFKPMSWQRLTRLVSKKSEHKEGYFCH